VPRKGTKAARELLQQIAAEYDIDVKSLRSPDRFACFTPARREFCIRGRELQIGVVALGIVLNRDHSTISYHANEAMRQRKKRELRNRPAYKLRTEEELFARSVQEATRRERKRALIPASTKRPYIRISRRIEDAKISKAAGGDRGLTVV
jgi:hypothetical protein